MPDCESFLKEYTKGALADDLAVELSVENGALLVVDMLNDFLTPGGIMAMEGASVIYSPLRKLIQAARKIKMPVIYVNDTHRPGAYDSEFDKRPHHCVAGTWGGAVVEELTPEPNDLIVTKRRYSGFFQTDLYLVLTELKVKTVVITGVMTNICVRATAHDAFFLGYNVIIPEDTCRASCQREQDSSLCDIRTCYGLVVPSAKLIEIMA